MFAKAKRPSGFRSFSFFVMDSWVMTRETNEELLLMILFFGFRLLRESLVTGETSAGFPSPKTGAMTFSFEANGWFLLALLTLTRDSLTPDVGGVGPVARGLGFKTGASDGCGGGVARCRSSLRWYVPIRTRSVSERVPRCYHPYGLAK